MRLGNAKNVFSSKYRTKSEPPSISGLIYAGRRHVLSGPPETLKTLISLAISLDHMRAGGNVAFIDFENGPNAVYQMLVDLGADEEEQQDTSATTTSSKARPTTKTLLRSSTRRSHSS